MAWPTRPGKVLSSSVVQKRDSEGDLTHHAEVVYVFNVNKIPLTVARELHMETMGPATLHMPKKL